MTKKDKMRVLVLGIGITAMFWVLYTELKTRRW